MKAQAVGFFWNQENAVTIDQFFAHLDLQIGIAIDHKKLQRLIYTADAGDFYIGLLITSRDHKTTCELVQQGRKYKVQIRRASKNVNPMDYNFFVVNKKTWHGLYLQYRGSCRLSSFGVLMRSLYNDCLANHKGLELGELAELGDSRSRRGEERDIRQKYKRGQFECIPLMRKEAIERLVRSLKKIHKFTWTYAIPRVKQSWFTSVKNYVSTERAELSFSTRVSSPSKIIAAIVEFIETRIPKRGTVYGTNASGDEIPISITDQVDVFEEWDYDDITSEQALVLEDIEKSPIFRALLDTAEDNRKIMRG